MGNKVAEEAKSFFDNIGDAFKQKSLEREFELIRENGFLKFQSPYAIKVFAAEHPDWKVDVKGDYHVFYPPKEYFEALKLITLCRKYTSMVEKKLSIILRMKSNVGECRFILTSYNKDLNSMNILHEQSVYFDSYFLAMVLPTLYKDMLTKGAAEVCMLENDSQICAPIEKFVDSQMLLCIGFDKERRNRINAMKDYVEQQLNVVCSAHNFKK